jgi:hypothetical protein
MAYKIYKSGNYLYVEDTVTKELIEGIASQYVFDKHADYDTSYFIFINGKKQLENAIDISDMVDGSLAPYTPETFKTFIESAATGTQPISVDSLPLPFGAATQATLAALLTELQLKADLTETQLVKQKLGSATTNSSVARNVASVTLLAADVDRKEAKIRNNSTGVLYLSHTSPATLNECVKLFQDDVYILDSTSEAIYGIWNSAGTGDARITQTKY